MNKVYYLSTCDTCKRILKELDLPDYFEFQDLKLQPVTEDDLERLYNYSKSYEALFNKRARLYKELGLKDKSLSEQDFKTYLLDHYTFLKRPVIITEDQIFIGNAKKTIESLKSLLNAK